MLGTYQIKTGSKLTSLQQNYDLFVFSDIVRSGLIVEMLILLGNFFPFLGSSLLTSTLGCVFTTTVLLESVISICACAGIKTEHTKKREKNVQNLKLIDLNTIRPHNQINLYIHNIT